jgi:hypothetical protein
MRQYTYRKRAFLHPPAAVKNSYICAIAESSRGGERASGDYYIVLADCHKAVEFEFSLSDPRQMKESLAKAELLARTFTEFLEALKAEAELIKNYKGEAD